MHRRILEAPQRQHPRRRSGMGLSLRSSLNLAAGLTLSLLGLAIDANAQTAPASTPAPAPIGLSLRQAFEAAWLRQPENAGLALRREAAQAQRQGAEAWTPEPMAVQLASKRANLSPYRGLRELDAGVAIPLWLPGERSSSQALAQAEGRAVESRVAAAQLRVAGAVREAWWTVQRARSEAAVAQSQLDNAQRIAADVARRLKAGDLAQADQHQADGAVAAAQAATAQARAALMVATQTLRTMVATAGQAQDFATADGVAEKEPAGAETDLNPALHGELLALQDRAAVAEGVAALAATQTRPNPELTVGAVRDRSASGEAWQQTVTVGIRIPFGAGARHETKWASARAEALEMQAQLSLERDRLAGERAVAQVRAEATRLQQVAAERRAQLALETRGFFDKSFRLGQTDLPTRLRIEAEAVDAERQAARARIERAAAISAWRQALGLLPQ
jgi:outer membrane protein, heavy metal efflux system